MGEVPSHVSCTQEHSICGDPERAVLRTGACRESSFLDRAHPRAKGKPEAASGLHLRFSPEKLRSRDGRGYLSAHSKSHLLPITIETRPTCPFSGSLTAPGAFLSFGACLPKAPVLHPRGQREGNVFSSFLGAGIGVAEPKDSHSAGGPGPAGTAARRDPSQQLASESSGRIYPSTAFAGSSDTDTIF